ncbi:MULTISPECIES: glutamate 5-kinase [Paenibacillus]|uniref:glutamate 5-kinase n=1 Tax=Paenibacillus TaxID=44249 RepID=UPI00020D6706|nr:MULTISPECIES: glutamate 5-kinase [Paenibacillus]EGL15993.1 glutamate 5-kinase [Paenibacillus sp. HGF7]EPD80836.1 glutamate 5-kinase [Paenibacillus sp. HGH0039]MBV6714702.1 glutamate 5-kinase [Paenibacillus chitinolyticus]
MQQRIVVKIGSSSLTSDAGGLNPAPIAYFAAELARLQQNGFEVVLVTSGAVAAGFSFLGYKSRPKLLHEKQAAASVGQALLMRAYQEAFHQYGIGAAQILLTRDDFTSRKRVSNATATMEELLRRGFIPIINENDTVSVDEIKFGDNDTLSALVANLLKAGQLIIITDTDGLYTDDPRKNKDARRIERVDEISDELYRIAGGSGSSVGTGGMRSKIEAARIAMRGGIPVFVGRATEPHDLRLAAEGNGRGTYFSAADHTLSIKKQWVGFHSVPQGKVTVDQGAENALLSGGKSLLPAGVTAVEGDFHPGDVIEVCGEDGSVIGRGVANYVAWQLQAVMGLGTGEIQRRVEVPRIEVIHRDEWVTLQAYRASQNT